MTFTMRLAGCLALALAACGDDKNTEDTGTTPGQVTTDEPDTGTTAPVLTTTGEATDTTASTLPPTETTTTTTTDPTTGEPDPTTTTGGDTTTDTTTGTTEGTATETGGDAYDASCTNSCERILECFPDGEFYRDVPSCEGVCTEFGATDDPACREAGAVFNNCTAEQSCDDLLQSLINEEFGDCQDEFDAYQTACMF